MRRHADFALHESGYWRNADPCPHGFRNCTQDGANATVALCAAKCRADPACAAFEVYSLGQPPPQAACYTFSHQLSPPFTPNDLCFTCVRK